MPPILYYYLKRSVLSMKGNFLCNILVYQFIFLATHVRSYIFRLIAPSTMLRSPQPYYPYNHYSWHHFRIKLDESITNLLGHLLPRFLTSEQTHEQQNNLFVLHHCAAKLYIILPWELLFCTFASSEEKQIILWTLMSNKLTEKINN